MIGTQSSGDDTQSCWCRSRQQILISGVSIGIGWVYYQFRTPVSKFYIKFKYSKHLRTYFVTRHGQIPKLGISEYPFEREICQQDNIAETVMCKMREVDVFF